MTMDLNDRRPPTRARMFDPKPYFPQRGADKGPSVGVQGKLFRDPKPADAARYPRGYTPERMREVRQTPLDVQHVGASSTPFGGPGGTRRLQEVVARSATPVSDLGLRHGEDEGLRIRTGVRMGAAGQYIEGGVFHHGIVELGHRVPQVWKGQGVGWRDPSRPEGEEQAGQALMHELGHHRSSIVERNRSSAYDTPAQRGKEEAFADDNMVSRWRPDPRDVRAGRSRPVKAGYEGECAHQGIGGKKSHAAYMRARKTPLTYDLSDRPQQRSLFNDRRR